MDVPSLMRQAMEFNRARCAIVFEGKAYSFAEAWERGVRVANALVEMGVRPGDRVAAVEDNGIAAADLFIGAAIAGAVRVPLYARNSRESHVAMLRSTKSKVLFADKSYSGAIAGVEADLPDLGKIIVRDENYEEWLAAKSARDLTIAVKGDDWYVIRHSSGTSGRPKGVGYTHTGGWSIQETGSTGCLASDGAPCSPTRRRSRTRRVICSCPRGLQEEPISCSRASTFRRCSTRWKRIP